MPTFALRHYDVTLGYRTLRRSQRAQNFRRRMATGFSKRKLKRGLRGFFRAFVLA